MKREQRRQLRAVSAEIVTWIDQAQFILRNRVQDDQYGQSCLAHLRRSLIRIRHGDDGGWQVIPLREADSETLTHLARWHQLPVMSQEERRALDSLTTEVTSAVDDANRAIGFRRLVSGGAKRAAGRNAADFLQRYRAWALSVNLPEMLARFADYERGRTPPVPITVALADQVGLRPLIAGPAGTAELVPVTAFSGLAEAVETLQAVLQQSERLRSAARASGEAVRERDARDVLGGMPVERLREATRDRLRIGPLVEAGIVTVQGVLDAGRRLEHLPGIGAATGTRVRGAARTLWQTTYDETPVRIEIEKRSTETTELLRRLNAWGAMRETEQATTDLTLAKELAPLASTLDSKIRHLIVVPWHNSVAELTNAATAVVRRAQLAAGTVRGSGPADPWEDFLARPADYFAMLSELGFLTEDEQKTHGDLPEDIVEAVRKLELDTQHLTASLRGYQSFGARFALVQRKVIIGDEMGLGKTIEALAVLAHLRSKGAHHFLVICPAAVVTNWIREIQSKSKLPAHRLHGNSRAIAAKSWVRNGGVAVTTFGTLGKVERYFVNDLGCVVVDEAHYIKNPDAKRTRRTVAALRRSDRAVVMTGTPLENRIEEFRGLVSYLRPDLVVDTNEFAPRRFRRQVAPAYLRRNQEDVLTELPQMVEVDEWLPMTHADNLAYRDAVAAGNFMAMRRAAMVHGGRSAKVQRLVELAEEAEENARRVIVFSYFRDVLDQVVGALPGKVFGPITGSVPAPARQLLVDQFSMADHGAVLVSQISAGGVGLNIQAASVVVICEPQLKPTTEWQAIARARRMGQLQTVQVHRLLSEDGVDRRITEILSRKRELFDEFARVSESASSAPEALDVSEAELARQVVAQERERLFSGGPSPRLPTTMASAESSSSTPSTVLREP